MSYFALLDDAQTNRAIYYSHYVRSDFLTAAQLSQVDELLQQGWQNQLHVMLTVDYEWGLPLMNLPASQTGYLALHWFAQQQMLTDTHAWLQQHALSSPTGISTPYSHTSEADYLADIERIQQAIARGDCYQINYTLRLHLNAYGDPIRLYQRFAPTCALCRVSAFASSTANRAMDIMLFARTVFKHCPHRHHHHRTHERHGTHFA